MALLGKVKGNMGDSTSQVEYYNKALALSPNDTVVMFNLGVAYEKSGNDAQALNTYRSLLKLKPGDMDALGRVAFIDNKLGKYEEAYKYFSALALKKPSKENLRGIVDASTGLNDSQKTIEACSTYLKIYKKDYEVALLLAKTRERVANTRKGKVRAKYLKDAIDSYIYANDIKANEKVEQKIIDLSKERRMILRDLR
jgi:tetratricopeptide (TPR) repeat protein